jgi:hypothetical protein
MKFVQFTRRTDGRTIHINPYQVGSITETDGKAVISVGSGYWEVDRTVTDAVSMLERALDQ